MDVILPLSLIKSEHAELEDKTSCLPFTRKVMAIRGDSQELSEEDLENIRQGIPNRSKQVKRLGNAQNRFKKNQRIPYDQQNGAG
ncbi:MAG: hypothetical protein JRE61_03760 [Deltaproteobacteria bacterium]|nr:hypothetical protein [Deltaproteobacteria bacterium]